MACDVIRPKVRPFLDDLLDEKDYHDIHAHLEGCESCRGYASSVGTLSYRLYELGQVPLPPDMTSAILYESQKRSFSEQAGPSETKPSPERIFFSRNQLFWMGVLVLLAISVALVFGIVTQQRTRKDSPMEVSGHPLPVSGQAPPGADNEWHAHLSISSRAELLEILHKASIEIKSESPNAIVFSVPKAGLEEFKSQMFALGGAVKEFGELDVTLVRGDAVQVSVYLE